MNRKSAYFLLSIFMIVLLSALGCQSRTTEITESQINESGETVSTESQVIESEEAEKSENSSQTVPKPSIIELANNTDYTVATIAKEANRINRKDEGEVFISLH